jgi:ATP-dependent Lon protease
MEVIQLSGYTEDEKAEIAKRHLIKKQVDNHGLNENEFVLKDKGLYEIIRHYTREAGVRNLEREISKLCRKVLTHIIKDKKKSVKVDDKNISDLLGVKKFKYGLAEEQNQIGVATGLAWTEVGGDLLSIEALKLPGKGRMKSTGKLGEVMKESIDAASSFVRSRSPSFGIIPTLFDKYDIHVHVPEGATPKDGPSAGIAMVTSIVSMLSETPIRKDVAMTGEVTLRGNVLPIGGLKEKLLAALRGGIKTVIIPKENAKDLVDIPDNVKNDLEIIPVKNVEEVLRVALTDRLQSIDWDFSKYENSDDLKGQESSEVELPN